MNTFLRENTAFKALAVFLALFVWYLSKESGEPIQMSFFTPVVFKNVPDSYQVESDTTQINIVALTRNRESFNPLEIQPYWIWLILSPVSHPIKLVRGISYHRLK